MPYVSHPSRYTTRDTVKSANARRLKHLETFEMAFRSVDGGILSRGHEKNKLMEAFVVADLISLKITAPVLLTKNLTDFDELANGSLGTVVEFRETDSIRSDEDILFSRLTRPPGFWPVVDFPCRSGNIYRVLVLPEIYSIENNRGTVLASRRQVGS